MTNTPTAVMETLTSNAGSAFDTAITITVAAIAIGVVIYFVRKGFRARM